ncbi:MAG: DUF1841 family protein [Burkholderiaceae bacterium]|jgi:hypothetical protein|nr:DUF1841 family protein [Burkholderiaceae bacterium]
MFNPTQEDVRRFFCGAWAKHQAGQPVEALEAIAANWIAEHPEWHDDFADAADAVARQYPEGSPGGNPFLHLAMHLSISEQCSIDQPRGIRQAVELLARRQSDLHAAHHVAMECLGQMLADAQASGQAPDGATYVAAVQRRATRNAHPESPNK